MGCCGSRKKQTSEQGGISTEKHVEQASEMVRKSPRSKSPKATSRRKHKKYKEDSLQIVRHSFGSLKPSKGSSQQVPPGDDGSDLESMNDILSQSVGSSSVESPPNVKVIATASKNRSKEQKKRLGKNKFEVGKTRGKTASIKVLDDDDEAGSQSSSILSQLTYVEGRSSVMGTGLGYRISATINSTAEMSKRAEPKTSSSVMI